jgi:hypothetical protein
VAASLRKIGWRNLIGDDSLESRANADARSSLGLQPAGHVCVGVASVTVASVNLAGIVVIVAGLWLLILGGAEEVCLPEEALCDRVLGGKQGRGVRRGL